MRVEEHPLTTAQPIWFGAPECPLFGWWHPAAGAAVPALAVLLCPPLGHEDLATHRPLRRLAMRLAAAGLPVLRVDLPGTGDSADAAEGEDGRAWPEAAQRALDLAADELRRRSGAPRLALVGLRLGALMAARCAAGRADVAALVAVLPVPSGRAWLRECRLLDSRSVATAVVRADPAQGIDLGGLALGPAPSQALAEWGWPEAAPLPPLLLIERDDLPAGRLAEALQASGTPVERRALAQLDRVTTVAHLAHVPTSLDEAVLGWLQAQATPASPPTPPPPPAVAALGPTVLLPLPLPGGGAVQASLVVLGSATPMVGLLERPARGATAPSGRGLLLLSTGAERRIGPNRLWVPFARERARRGDVVLRLDLPGIGDSALRDETSPTDLYDARCAADIAAALDWLRREQGVQHGIVAGVCSGAYHAWRAALEGAACETVIAINPLVFHWHAGLSLDPSEHAFGRAAVASQAVQSLRDPQRWLKLLRGQVHLRVIGRALLGRAQDAWVRRRRALARRLGRPLPEDLAADLLRVVGRGVRPCFVFSEGDPGQWLLAEQGGAVYQRLRQQGRLDVSHLPGADHTLSHRAAREALWDRLHGLIDTPPGPAP